MPGPWEGSRLCPHIACMTGPRPREVATLRRGVATRAVRPLGLALANRPGHSTGAPFAILCRIHWDDVRVSLCGP